MQNWQYLLIEPERREQQDQVELTRNKMRYKKKQEIY